MTRRLSAGLAAIVLVASAQLGGQTGPVQPADPTREFPSGEPALSGLVREGAWARAADRAYREAPADANTIRLLFDVSRIDDALQSLEVAARGPLENAIAAMKMLGDRFSSLTSDASRGYAERVPAIIAPLRTRIPTLPREDAARLALNLLRIDTQLNGGFSRGWTERVAAFANEYRGTQAGLLAQVLVVESGVDRATKLAGFDAIVAANPGSEAAAMALYLKGFRVAADTVEGRGGDPTSRFMQAVAIVDELESGRYPDCEWVRKAPDLVTSFYISSSPPPAFQPGNLDRMLAEYQRFVRKHFTSDVSPSNGVGYLIAYRIAGLYGAQGDRDGGVEKTLRELEASGADKRAIALFHAEDWAIQANIGPDTERVVRQTRAESALTTLANDSSDFYSRRAAARLAGLLMYQRDDTRALAAYQAYASRFPSSPFAWVARLRAGQCLVELGDLSRAAAMFEAAASSAPEEPLAVVLGSALAAQTYDAIGQFDRSLVAYRRSLQGWTWEYWRDLTPTPSRVSRPSPPAGEPTTLRPVTQQNLIDRVASLERNMRTAVGPSLERAASQINLRRFSDARATLASAATQARSDDDRTAVRQLDHRAQFELAMALLAADGASSDVTRSLQALDSIAPVPFDASVGFAAFAKAALMFRNGAAEHAQVLMNATLEEWLNAQQGQRATKPASPLEADIAEIRNLTFRSIGTVAVLAPGSMLAKAYPLPPGYAVVNPDVRVTTPDGKTSRMTLYQDLPDDRRAIFWTTDEIAIASRLVNTLAGPRRTTPPGTASAPDPSAAALANLRGFWNGFFATRDDNMGSWIVQTYPGVTSITFLDASRKKAAVGVRADAYSGATIIMEKKNGVWVALRIVNQWIS